MRTLLIAASAFALITAPAVAQSPQGPDPEAVYKAAGAKASAPVATVAYGTDAAQVADLRLPKGPGPYPVAIVIHGGCWRADIDSRHGIAGFADALGRRGFATWNIEYRRLGAGGGWPMTFQDVAAAVDKLAEVAPKHRLDMHRVTIVGHSAGAHLALWAASRARLPAPWSASPVKPVSVVAIDGPGALAPFVGIDAQVCGAPVIAPLMGGAPADKPDAYALASPADHLPLGLRQLLVEAELGGFMKPYAEAATSSGDTVEVIEPKNANHFDIVTPGTPNGETVLDFIARKALDKPVAAP